MPVFYDLKGQEFGTSPASRDCEPRRSGDERLVYYGVVGRACDFFPLVFRVVIGFLECQVEEVWLRFLGPTRAAIVL